jgi:hypothetical protein
VLGEFAHALLWLLEEMLPPARFIVEVGTPDLGAGEKLADLLGGGVHGEWRKQRPANAVPAPPRHQPRHVVAGDLGDQLVLAKKLNQPCKLAPRIAGTMTSMMLPHLPPVAASNIVEPQRGPRGFRLHDVLLGALALDRLYFFGFPPGRGLGTPVKAITSPPKIVLPERRAGAAVEGHGTSLRV